MPRYCEINRDELRTKMEGTLDCDTSQGGDHLCVCVSVCACSSWLSLCVCMCTCAFQQLLPSGWLALWEYKHMHLLVCIYDFYFCYFCLYVWMFPPLLCKCIATCASFTAFQLKPQCGAAKDLNTMCPSRMCVVWEETVGFKLLLVLWQHIKTHWLTSSTVSDVSFSSCQNK